MLEIKVTIEAKDLSESITKLAEALGGGIKTDPAPYVTVTPAVVQNTAQPEMPEPVQDPIPEPAPVPDAAPVAELVLPKPEPEATPVQEPVPEPVPKPIDLDTISRAGAALVDQGKMADVLKILQEKYGIFAVTQLDPSQYPAFAADLRALGANI